MEFIRENEKQDEERRLRNFPQEQHQRNVTLFNQVAVWENHIRKIDPLLQSCRRERFNSSENVLFARINRFDRRRAALFARGGPYDQYRLLNQTEKFVARDNGFLFFMSSFRGVYAVFLDLLDEYDKVIAKSSTESSTESSLQKSPEYAAELTRFCEKLIADDREHLCFAIENSLEKLETFLDGNVNMNYQTFKEGALTFFSQATVEGSVQRTIENRECLLL